VPKDLARAEALYRKCLELDPDHAHSHNNLGALYAEKLRAVIDTIDGDNIRTNRALMLEHYEAAVRRQSAYAARNLGEAYYEGRLVPKDYQKSYQYYEQAADWGMPVTHYSLGYMHEYGQGVPITLTEAAYHYRLAALEGNQEALRRLINFYLTGMGVSLDLDRAIFWMQQMVRQGNARVLTHMCDILLRKQNYADVIPLLRQMTNSPDHFISGFAYDRLARCYERGLGVKANPGRAKKYNELAIKHGNGSALTELAMQQMKQGKREEAVATFLRAAPTSPDAAYALGQMYYFGTNVEQDKAKALQFIRLAANGNQINALFFLAALTYNQEPDAPTLEQAILYAQQAENIGHNQAGAVREKLEQRRKSKEATPEEAARARSL
jgi:TPR repeat protein